ncbi:unnamed protein product [Durusdinium trenchii]|uniref:DNA topoisomerase 3-alpha (DNA topoisomerase III alpha) n=1 Tax=Durusdinium trenchii TaxID=1381693 RepID=A0ABP0RET0_9DINO
MPLTQPMHGLCQPAQSFPVHQGGQALLSTQVQAPPSFGQANPMSFASHTGSQAGQQPFGGVPAPPPSQFREPQALAFEPAVFGGSQVQAQPQRTESGLAHGFGQFPAQSQYGTIPEGNQHLFAQGQQPPQPFGVPSFSPVAQMDQSHFQFPMNSPDSRNCSCGQPALLLNVKKEGPNQGRGFWKCAKQNPEQPCGFFEWADEPPRSSGNGANGHGANGHSQAQGMMPQLPPGPACTCGQPSLGLTVKKDGPNKGRVFFKCAQGQCGHFQWADQEPDPPGPPCSCGVPSVRRTVQKEGPNRGRPFMICVKRGCDFFAWGDEEGQRMARPRPQCVRAEWLGDAWLQLQSAWPLG